MSKTKKVGLLPAFIISFLVFGGFIGIASAMSKGGLRLTSIVQAESGSDNEEGDNENDNENDSAEQEKQKQEKEREKEKRKQEKEREKRAAEEAKKKVDIQRELLKRKTENLRRIAQVEDDNEVEDAPEAEDQGEENEDDDNGKDDINHERADILDDIYGQIFDAAERIEKARLEGIDVTKALATLEEAKAKAKLAEQSLATADIAAAKRLAQEVKKLAHFARNKDVHDSRDIQKDIDKVAKRISQTEGKIFLLNSLGGDTASATESLNKAKADFTSLKEQITKGGNDLLVALPQLEPLERRVKTIKSSVENAIYALGGTDENLDDDVEHETEDLVGNLNDIAEIEGDQVGEDIKGVAMSQKEAAKRVAEKVKKADERNRFLQILFGSDDSDMKAIATEISENKSRIQTLTEAAQKIEDPEVKALLMEQVKSLEQETSKLEAFVAGQENRLSVLGWFFKLF